MTGVGGGGGGGEVTELKALTAKWCEITPSPGVHHKQTNWNLICKQSGLLHHEQSNAAHSQ